MISLALSELSRYQREFPRILKSRKVSLPKFKEDLTTQVKTNLKEIPPIKKNQKNKLERLSM